MKNTLRIATIALLLALSACAPSQETDTSAPVQTEARQERPREETPEEIIARLYKEAAEINLQAARVNQKTARIEKRASKGEK